MKLVGTNVSSKIGGHIMRVDTVLNSISKDVSGIENNMTKIKYLLDSKLKVLHESRVYNLSLIDSKGDFIISYFEPSLREEYIRHKHEYFNINKLKKMI